jgi:hypothetical protein
LLDLQVELVDPLGLRVGPLLAAGQHHRQDCRHADQSTDSRLREAWCSIWCGVARGFSVEAAAQAGHGDRGGGRERTSGGLLPLQVIAWVAFSRPQLEGRRRHQP